LVLKQVGADGACGPLTGAETAEFVARVLGEDLGAGGDVTSRATIDADARFVATMNCREADCRRRASGWRRRSSAPWTQDVQVERCVGDGESVAAGTVLMRIEGNARAMLGAERSALNTLSICRELLR
jgi:nicotinate-nucleotide pyrophosphorylase (carboxylating)